MESQRMSSAGCKSSRFSTRYICTSFSIAFTRPSGCLALVALAPAHPGLGPCTSKPHHLRSSPSQLRESLLFYGHNKGVKYIRPEDTTQIMVTIFGSTMLSVRDLQRWARQRCARNHKRELVDILRHICYTVQMGKGAILASWPRHFL